MIYKESNESRIARAELKLAVEFLVRAATRNNAAVTGFIFGVNPPLIIRFGNTKEKGPELASLLLKLCDLAEEREEAGLLIEDPILPEEGLNKNLN